MPRQLWIADALRDEGLTVREVDGWKTRGTTNFDPVGVLVHHTAAPIGRTAPSLNVVIHGRRNLPGPLCQILIGRDGVCHIIAAGRANHAGRGKWTGISDGNGQFIGIEAENDGVGEPWGADVYQATVLAAAACARQGADRPVLGHKEWSPGRKIDPTFGMDLFRAHVKAHRRNHPTPSKENTMTTTTTDESYKPGDFAGAYDELGQDLHRIYDAYRGPNDHWHEIEQWQRALLPKLLDGESVLPDLRYCADVLAAEAQ